MKRMQFALIGLLMTALISSNVPRAEADLFDSFGSYSSSSSSCDTACDAQPKPKCCAGAWFRADYLYWQTAGMKLPPLVTANPLGTDPADAGVIGIPSTHIVSGNGTALESGQSGMRYSAGVNICCRVGVEVDYFALESKSFDDYFDGNSNVILGRPFINLSPLAGPVRWDTQLIEFPPNLRGAVNVKASSSFQGGGARLRFCVLKNEVCVYDCPSGCDSNCNDPCGSCEPMCCVARKVKCSQLDFTFGYRYLQLDENLWVGERVENPSEVFRVFDDFDAESIFNGLELGMDYTCFHKHFGFNIFGRCALGTNSNRLRIAGLTEIDGVVQSDRGGILAQASNIGATDHTMAAMNTHLGCNLNVCLCSCLYGNLGYSAMYWTNVVRPGEQIDTRVNPDLFPPITAVPGTVGALRTHKLSDYYAHGLNFGVTLVL